jgi:hypothetical protein
VIALALLWLAAAPAVDAGSPPDASPPADGGLAPDAMPVETAVDATPLFEVSGTLLVRGSRDILPVARLFVDGQPVSDSDDRGHFTLRLAAGPHVIGVREPGFEPLDSTVVVTPQLGPLTLRLSPTAGPRYETTVNAPAPVPRLHLEQEQMTRTPGALGDPFRVIESLPGVAPILWPLPVYAVRGANPGNTGFFIDGVRVPALFHFALGPAVVHPYFLGGLDFYSGVAPAQYGRSVAGLVAASTATPPNDRLRGSLDLRIYDVGGLLSSPFDGGRGTATVAGRFGYPGAVLSQISEDLSLQYWDYQARLDHPLGPGAFTLLLLGSYDSFERKEDFGFGGEPGEKVRLALSFHRADLRWSAALGRGRLFAALGAGFDRTSVPYDRNAELDARGRSLMPRLRFDRPLGAAADFRIGTDAELSDYDTTTGGLPPEISAGFTRPRKMRAVGLWSDLVLRLGRRVTLAPGLRLDGYQEGGAREVDLGPRLSLTVRTSDRLAFTASAGRSSQLPSLPLQLPGWDGFGLEQHGLQTAWQAAVGAQAALPGTLTLESTAFVHRYVLTDIRDPDLGDPLLADFLTRRQALAYGLELMLRRPPSARLYGWLSYTLSRALRAFEGGVVGPADWDQRHIVNLVAGYRWRRWTFGGRIHLHSGRFVKVIDTQPTEFDRLPPFYQLDLRVDRRFLLDRMAIEVFLEIVNTTLTRQVVALRQQAVGYQEDGFQIALPSLGMRLEF